jgi:hypothetical protein
MTDPVEDRLRERLARYGSALERAAAAPAPTPRPHLVVVDGPAAPPPRRRGAWLRAAAVVALLAALAGTTYAATRPGRTATTAVGAGWTDDDLVRPEDRASAFAALDGSWPLPPGGSLRHVVDRPTGTSPTFAAFRAELADAASCLWFRTAYEHDLDAAGREAVTAMPTWPGHAGDRTGVRALQPLVAAALAGDADALRPHLAARCGGSGAALGLPEVGAYWLVAGGGPAPAGPAVAPGGPAVTVDVDQVRGWDTIARRLGPGVEAGRALSLGDGAYNVALTTDDLAFSLTLARVGGPVTLPVDESAFAGGHRLRADGVEVFAGPIGGDATLAQAVGPGGASVGLSFDAPPGEVEDALGDVADLVVDLHDAAWPR